MNGESGEAVEEVEVEETGEGEGETGEEQAGNEEITEGAEEEEFGEVVVTVDGEEPEEKEESKTFVELRKVHRETLKREKKQKKELEELKNQLANKSGENAEELGPRPVLADLGFDQEAYDKAVDAWHEKKVSVEKKQSTQKAQKEQQDKEWQETLKTYDSGKEETTKTFPDFEESEELVETMFDETQMGIIKHAVADAAKVVYQLGKLPAQIKRLSEIKDPVKFTYEIAQLVPRLKMEKKRPATKPEEAVSGSGVMSPGPSKQLAKLEAEADKNGGDRTKVIAFKKQLKNKKKE
jgi:hypothetical protein